MTARVAPSCPMAVALGVVATALGVGCGGSSDPAETQLANDGTEAMVASSQSTSLTSVVFDAVTVDDPAMAAAQLVSPASLFPWACAARSADTSALEIVQLTFNKCTGPFGLVNIEGSETVDLSAGPNDALRATVASTSLKAEGSPIAHGATSDISFTSATQRSVIWQGTWVRTNDQGEVVSHDADLEITVDRATGCRTSTGSAATNIATRSVDTVVDSYRMCRDAVTGLEGCPTGTVVHTSMPSGKTVTVTYDASATATVTGVKGDTFELPLSCVPIGT